MNIQMQQKLVVYLQREINNTYSYMLPETKHVIIIELSLRVTNLSLQLRFIGQTLRTS